MADVRIIDSAAVSVTLSHTLVRRGLRRRGLSLGRRLSFVILFGILIGTPVISHYLLSYRSVSGTVVDFVTAYRSTEFFTATYSIVYHVTIRVGSWTTSLDTRVAEPRFSLTVDSIPIQTVLAPGGTFKPYGQLEYNLSFNADFQAASRLRDTQSDNLLLTMDALVASGTYQETMRKTASATWTWSE